MWKESLSDFFKTLHITGDISFFTTGISSVIDSGYFGDVSNLGTSMFLYTGVIVGHLRK